MEDRHDFFCSAANYRYATSSLEEPKQALPPNFKRFLFIFGFWMFFLSETLSPCSRHPNRLTTALLTTPPGTNICFFRSNFHNWPDSACWATIRHTIRATTPPGGLPPPLKPIISDILLPPTNAAPFDTLTDLQMIAFGGMERTEKQWRELLEGEGLSIERFVQPETGAQRTEFLIECVWAKKEEEGEGPEAEGRNRGMCFDPSHDGSLGYQLSAWTSEDRHSRRLYLSAILAKPTFEWAFPFPLQHHRALDPPPPQTGSRSNGYTSPPSPPPFGRHLSHMLAFSHPGPPAMFKPCKKAPNEARPDGAKGVPENPPHKLPTHHLSLLCPHITHQSITHSIHQAQSIPSTTHTPTIPTPHKNPRPATSSPLLFSPLVTFSGEGRDGGCGGRGLRSLLLLLLLFRAGYRYLMEEDGPGREVLMAGGVTEC